MKVAFVIYDMGIYGGIERVVANLANALVEEHQIHLISLCGQEQKPSFHLDPRIQCYQLGMEKQRLRNLIRTGKKVIQQFFSEHTYDVILAEGNIPGMVFLPFCRKPAFRKRLIFCDHGSIMSQWSSKGKTISRFLMSLCYRKTVVVTERSRMDYIQKFHLSEKKISCIYNWIEDDWLAQENCYNSKSKQILSVGRFGKEKGYDMLVQVAKQCMPAHPDWQWHIYGDGETFEQIQQSLQELQLDQQVILKGAVQDILSRYKDYAFLVLPSYREGLPLALLEAQAAHLPLVSFDVITGPAEIVVDGVNGYLIPPYDIEGMAAKISQLMESEDTRQSFSDHAYDKINRFSKQVILEKWKQLLEG